MNKNMLSYSIMAVMTVLPAGLVSASDPFAELDAATSTGAQAPQNDQAEFQKYLQQHQSEFADYKKKLMEEFGQYKKIYEQETKKYQSEVSTVWDKPELSSQKVWVEYSKDMNTRKRVDFEQGVIQISTTAADSKAVTDQAMRSQLKSLLMKNQAEAFRDDKVAQAIEKKSKEKLTLIETAEVKPTPILIPYVAAKPNPSEKEVDKIVDNLMSKKTQKVEANSKGGKVVTLQVPLGLAQQTPASGTDKKAKPMADLLVNKLPKGARDVAGDVQTFSTKVNLDNTLVFAIIETESAFNPMAKSPIPAYGLMQIVPSSAGMDVTEMLFGKSRILSPSYLYARDKNIEVGTTYLHILQSRYLKGVQDPLSRLYCSIAAYNTGAGNVAKAFTGDRKLQKALPIINNMKPQEVYNHLIKNLPYDETRLYLQKVVSRMPKYSA